MPKLPRASCRVRPPPAASWPKTTAPGFVDLGDDVLALEFHTKMNAIDADVVGMMQRAIDGATTAAPRWSSATRPPMLSPPVPT